MHISKSFNFDLGLDIAVGDKQLLYPDQEDRRLRHLMRCLILPRLHQMGISTVLGVTDFGGGPLGPSIAGAVTSTGKTVVFFSKDIFQVN